MKKIVYLSLAWIWDYLMQTPAIMRLKQEKWYQIDLITMSKTIEDLWKYSWLFDNVYRFDLTKKPFKEFWELIKHWLDKKYDISILWFPTYRKEYHITQFLLGAKKRLYHRFKTWWFIKEFHFLGTDYIYFDEDKHNVENNLLLTKLWINIDLDNINKKYVLKIPKRFIEYGENFIRTNNMRWKIIWIHSWSTTSPAALLRRWWWKKYVSLIKDLINNWNTILIFWWPEEKDDILKMKEQLISIKNVFFVEESFFNSIWILSQVDLLITNDNWFGHIWAWLWINVLSLWWTTFDKWSAPIWRNVKVLKKTKIKPWYRYEYKQQIPRWFENKDGMDDIKIEDVLKEIKKFALIR